MIYFYHDIRRCFALNKCVARPLAHVMIVHMEDMDQLGMIQVIRIGEVTQVTVTRRLYEGMNFVSHLVLPEEDTEDGSVLGAQEV